MPNVEAERQLDTFIDKFDPANQKLIRSVRKAMRKRLPAAMEMVYDNYNFFVIGYSPTERPSHAILSIAAQASGVSICFLNGAKLPDPKKILRGSGNQVRSMRIERASELARPEVDALIDAAIATAKAPFETKPPRRLIIKSISPKQRPRRKDK